MEYELKVDKFQEKEDFLSEIQRVAGGKLPANARYFLKLLAHPDLITHTVQFFTGFDVDLMCLKYEAPWSCVHETEAQFENVTSGWLGAGRGQLITEWCENCKRRVIGDKALQDLELPEEPDPFGI